MHRLPSFNQIALASIDLEDRTFRFSPASDLTPDHKSLESIRQFGILHPPIVKQRDKRIIVVTGWKRIQAALQTGMDNILCLLVPEDAGDDYCCRIVVEESLFSRQLSLVEQMRLLNLFLTLKPAEDALPLLNKLGHKPQKHTLDEILSLLALDDKTLETLHNGKLSFKTARQLLKFPMEDRELLVELINLFHLGGSKQQKLIEYSTEIMMRSNKSITQAFKEFPGTEVLEEQFNVPQLRSSLLTWLHKQCHPKETEAEEHFRKSVAVLGLPDNMQLDHSPSFEDDRVILSIDFSDMRSFQVKLPEIQGIVEKKKFSEPANVNPPDK